MPTLSLRLANERRNQILEAQVSVTLVRDEQTGEGDWIRRFYDLQLARQRSPIFAMTFTVMHPIDANSPLRNATPTSLAAEGAENVVTVTGIDDDVADDPRPHLVSGSRNLLEPTLCRRLHADAGRAAGDRLPPFP